LSVKFLGRVISRLGETRSEVKAEKLRTSGTRTTVIKEEVAQ
jgi:hypothetical protein